MFAISPNDKISPIAHQKHAHADNAVHGAFLIIKNKVNVTHLSENHLQLEAGSL